MARSLFFISPMNLYVAKCSKSQLCWKCVWVSQRGKWKKSNKAKLNRGNKEAIIVRLLFKDDTEEEVIQQRIPGTISRIWSLAQLKIVLASKTIVFSTQRHSFRFCNLVFCIHSPAPARPNYFFARPGVCPSASMNFTWLGWAQEQLSLLLA